MVSDGGNVYRFAKNEVVPENIAMKFRTARLPIIEEKWAHKSWWCSACRAFHAVDDASCVVSDAECFRVVSDSKVMSPNGQLVTYPKGHVVVGSKALELMQVLLVERADDSALVTSTCPTCGAAFRSVRSDPWTRERVSAIREEARREAAARDAGERARLEEERLSYEQRMAKKVASWERIRALKAKQVMKERDDRG